MFSMFDKYIRTGLIASACFLAGAFMGWKYEYTQFVRYQAGVEAQGVAAIERQKEIAAKQERDIDEVKRNYENRMSASSTYYQRMLDNYTRSGKLPSTDTSASGSDAAITYALSHPIELASDCAKTTVIAQGLQEYVRSIK